MKILFDPEWKKQGNFWSLFNDTQIATILNHDYDYLWEISEIETGKILSRGITKDLQKAKSVTEKHLGYLYFIEQEYYPTNGCRCGSCVEPTGKWVVYNHDHSVSLHFNSEQEAINWISSQSLE